MATEQAFRDIADAERDEERPWDETHAPRDSAACYSLAIDELRRKYEAGEPILSEEYAPIRAAERALYEGQAA